MPSPALIEMAERAERIGQKENIFGDVGRVFINITRHNRKDAKPDYSVENFFGWNAWNRAFEDAVVNYPCPVGNTTLEYHKTIVLWPDGRWETIDFEKMEPYPDFIREAQKERYGE